MLSLELSSKLSYMMSLMLPFNGPYRAPKMNLKILLFLHQTLYIIHFSPFNHVGTLFWSLWNSTKGQGALLDHHGPQNGPHNGSCEANSRGPSIEKGPPGSFHGPNWSIFFYRPLDNGLTWIYSLVWGQSDIWFRSYNFLKHWWAYMPPPQAD